MKKLLLLGLLATIFGCQSAAPDDLQERLVLKTNDGKEFSISKGVIVRFSGLIREYLRDYAQFFASPVSELVSFEEGIVKPEALKVLLPILEEASSVLIEKPVSKKGSYRELADLIIERDMNINALLKLMVLAEFFQLDERIKQACALAVINQMEKDFLPCRAICGLLPDDLLSPNILPYIAQQYYLTYNDLPELFKTYFREIGLAIRDLVIYGKEFPIVYNTLQLSKKYIKDVDGIIDIPGIDQVTYLYLENNQLRSIEGLNNLPLLAGLSLKCNRLHNIGGLNDLPNLRNLGLEKNQLWTIEGLNNLPNLTSLYLDDNNLETIEGLNNLPLLERLSLKYNRLYNIEGLNDLPSLEWLNLEQNKLQIVKELNLPRLTSLYLEGNRLQTIGVNYLPLLEELKFDGKYLQSTKWRDNLPNLRSLFINYS